MIISIVANYVSFPVLYFDLGKWGGGQVIGNQVENLVGTCLFFGDSFVVVQNLDSLGKGEDSEKEGD